MILTIILTAIVAVGLVAIARAHPPRSFDIPVWSDDVERRLLQRRKIDRW